MWEVDKAMCGINDHTVVSHEVNPLIGPVRFFNTRKCSAKMWSPMSNLSVVVAIGYLTGHLLPEFESWEVHRFL